MADKQPEIPVILKLYDLTLWTMQHTAQFPRHHRYSLGTKIDATLLNCWKSGSKRGIRCIESHENAATVFGGFQIPPMKLRAFRCSAAKGPPKTRPRVRKRVAYFLARIGRVWLCGKSG
jgi:hypothetical protein